MKIEIEIDDKYSERNLYVFAANDPVARRKVQNGYWEVKVAECSRCGKCCASIKGDHPFKVGEGCVHLFDSGSEQLCGIGFPNIGWWRPHGCAVSDPTWIESCTVRWGKVE